MDNSIDKLRERQIITRMRAVAVFLIVLAHCNAIPQDSSLMAKKLMELCSSVSFFGVWIFFLLGGYLLAYEKRSLWAVIKRKSQTILLPWLFTGTVVYLYTILRHGELSLWTYTRFILGYGSYLWYMTVYTVLMTLFLFFRDCKWFPWIAIVTGIIFNATGILYSFVGERYELYYFVGGGWPIAFGLGYLLNDLKIQRILYRKIVRYGWIWTATTIGAVLLSFSIKGRWYYWSDCYVWLCILVTPTIFLIASCSSGNVNRNRMLEKIGGDSFSIYLTHMPVVGLINNLLCRVDGGYSVAIRPFLVIGITELALTSVCRFSKRLKCENAVYTILGKR